MSIPRNVAHAKKVTQEKKHHGADTGPKNAPTGQPGKKPAAMLKKHDPAGAAAAAADADTAVTAPLSESPTPAALEGSLVVLAKLKEMEFHSRGNLERLAELVLTVGDELKQQQIVGPLDEVYSAQNVFQTKLTALIEAYQAECDRFGRYERFEVTVISGGFAPCKEPMRTTERVTMTLAAELVEGIDHLERNRSWFIAEAVERELSRRRLY